MADTSAKASVAEAGGTSDAPVPQPRKSLRRRASRAAGPAAADSTAEAAVITGPVVESPPKPVTAPNGVRPLGPPPRRQPNYARFAWVAGAAALVVVAVLSTVVLVLTNQQRHAEAQAAREQRFVDTATQTVVNMFTYTPDTIDLSVNRFVDGISGPLRDMMSQNDNVENLKSLFRDTNATSEAVVNGAALEAVNPDTDNGSVLVSVRVTVTDVDGVNKPSQAYRMRVIVHEDDNGRMTGYDLKYPEGGN
ncbi:mammalian cell entry protein [Mycolicibacterium mengxianglii]|uniref:mammalian cell entry protein n=1 Tax=Mycolicibacterium mengxianglii TaxID=2736649 RepID=UPI001E45C008|nr:mammalian cell entry protein [Mycolicibacterium mengxianglii]